MSDSICALLEKADLFKGVPGIDELVQNYELSSQKFQQGQEIIGKDEQSTEVFFVLDGSVIARSFSAEGKEVSFVTVDQGGLFGEFSAIDRQPRSASVHAASDCLVARLNGDDFRDIVSCNSQIALRFAELLVAKARGLSKRVYEYGTQSVQKRLLKELLRMANSANSENGAWQIHPAPSHYEIATRIATHREAVSRELSQLAKAEVITLARLKITICDIERLRALAE